MTFQHISFNQTTRWGGIGITFGLLLTIGSSGTAIGSDADVRLDDQTPYYSHESGRSVGDRGEVHLDVSISELACGEHWRFHSAELVIRRNRFGDAQFIALPARGCIECADIVVRWMHEPTGHIEFDVNVFRERHFESCEETDQ